MTRWAGSWLAPGASYRLWRHYADQFLPRYAYALAAPASADAWPAARSRQAAAFRLPRYWFCPAPLSAPGWGAPRRVGGMATGTRTMTLDAASARELGLPETLRIDLAPIGWGRGELTLRPEIKGAGAPLSHLKLDPGARERISEACAAVPRLHRWALKHLADSDPHWTSLSTYERRPLGGQAAEFGAYAVAASTELLGACPVRLAPTIQATLAPPSWKSLITRVMAPPDGSARFEGSFCTEVRYSPGNVRAAYFDTVRGVDQRVRLIDAVSTDQDVLAATYRAVTGDLVRYVETLAAGARWLGRPRQLVWPKFGDVHIVFRPDRHGRTVWADEYRHRKHAAWYLAKDEVVVAGVGKVLLDAESAAPCFPVASRELMRWQHGLYLLNLLRDHARVALGFQLAWQEARVRRGQGTRRPRGELVQGVTADLLALGRVSPWFCLEAHGDGVVLALRYTALREADVFAYTWREILGPDL